MSCKRIREQHLRQNARSIALVFVFVLCSLWVTSCATSPNSLLRVEPPKIEKTEEDNDDSELPENVLELLRLAEQELKKANEAHEKGDYENAFRHYQNMLKLLLDANLHPSLYYESSGKLEEILRFYLKHAHLYHHPDGRLGASRSKKYNDIIIPFPLPEAVKAEIAELQECYPGTFQRGLNRSTRYMPYIKEHFRSVGLPEDLAWLAMVESMFQPKVVSPAGAGGMWQFMRATGRRFNLRMDSYVDERYNWHSATHAAAEYLKALHDFFNGDWALAITAYNMGEGAMDRAITANGGQRDFWSLIQTPPASDCIKQESKKFYPRLLAYMIVANAPEQYGFSLNSEPFEDVIRIPVDGSYFLADIERAMNISPGTLTALNPDLLQEITPPNGRYAVAVPRGQKEAFLAALSSVKPVHFAANIHHVRRGETLNQIAQRYGVSEAELIRINNLKNARAIQPNQALQIPDSGTGRGGGKVSVAEKATQTKAAKMPSAKDIISSNKTDEILYTVKAGDTLYDIAQSHNVTVTEIKKLNPLEPGGILRVGQQLKLVKVPETKEEPRHYHEVKPGEHPAIIAKLYGMSTSDLLALNNLTPRSVIRPGDRLQVNGKPTPTSIVSQTKPAGSSKKASPEPRIHKVAAGETASTIAAKYQVKMEDLFRWNNLNAKSIIRVGQELIVQNPGQSGEPRDTSGDVKISQSKKTKVIHKVAPGQNPSTIAKHYGVRVQDLYKWNNWSNDPVLRVGDEIAIYRD